MAATLTFRSASTPPHQSRRAAANRANTIRVQPLCQQQHFPRATDFHTHFSLSLSRPTCQRARARRRTPSSCQTRTATPTSSPSSGGLRVRLSSSPTFIPLTPPAIRVRAPSPEYISSDGGDDDDDDEDGANKKKKKKRRLKPVPKPTLPEWTRRQHSQQAQSRKNARAGTDERSGRGASTQAASDILLVSLLRSPLTRPDRWFRHQTRRQGQLEEAGRPRTGDPA